MTRSGMKGGSRPLDPARNAAVLALLDGGMTQFQVARHLGVTKNVVVGIVHRAGRNAPMVDAKATTIERLNALHARLDAVLAETRDIGKLPSNPRKKEATIPIWRF